MVEWSEKASWRTLVEMPIRMDWALGMCQAEGGVHLAQTAAAQKSHPSGGWSSRRVGEGWGRTPGAGGRSSECTCDTPEIW